MDPLMIVVLMVICFGVNKLIAKAFSTGAKSVGGGLAEGIIKSITKR